MHVGQPVVPALEAEREFLVIETEQVQDRRVQVVDVDAIARDMEAKFIGLADRDAGLHTAAGQLH